MTGERFANTVLGGCGSVCTLGFGYVIYYYDWTQTRYFNSSAGMVLYHVLPAVVAGLLFAALRLRLSYKMNLSLLLLSTAASLYALEVFLPSVVVSPMRISMREAAARKADAHVDPRDKLEVLKGLRRKGIEAYPTITSRVLLERQADAGLKSRIGGGETLPLAGIANTAAVFCNESGDWVIYESDEHGFHNPKGIWNAGRVEIVALGDSYAEGWCVPSDKNFVALIRKRYPATLNLALGANGPLLELAAIKEYAQFVKPQVVLWFFFEGNDLCDLRIERHSPLLMRYLLGDFTQGLLAKQAEIDRSLATFLDTAIAAEGLRRSTRAAEHLKGSTNPVEYLERAVGMLTLRHLRERVGLVYGGHDAIEVPFAKAYGCVVASGAHYLDVFREEEVELFRTVLLQAKTSVSAWGGRLYFVYLPEWQRYNNPAIANKDRERVLTLVRSLGIPVIDVHQAFQAQSDPLALFPFRLQGHYNADGHRMVAAAVLRSLSLGRE